MLNQRKWISTFFRIVLEQYIQKFKNISTIFIKSSKYILFDLERDNNNIENISEEDMIVICNFENPWYHN